MMDKKEGINIFMVIHMKQLKSYSMNLVELLMTRS